MNITKIISGLIIMVLLLTTAVAFAQPFASDIKAFKKADSISFPFPGQHPVLFIGSSSFTKWKDVQDYFPVIPIVNRGFGGSTLPDVIRYAPQVISPYKPKQVVIYCGENDLASSDTVTAKIVLNRFKDLFNIIRNEFPKAQISFVSIKPSPSRKNIQTRVIAANSLIKSFLKKKKNAAFIDVYSLMLNADGSMMQELFLEDDLHMNAKGYAIWQKAMTPYLLK